MFKNEHKYREKCCLLAVCAAEQMFQIITTEDMLEKLSQSRVFHF